MVPVDGFCIDKYEYPNKAGEQPKIFVAFVEAQKLCLEQGKHLCTTDEWVRACSGPANLQYPYGNQFLEGGCNLAKYESTHSWTWYGLRKKQECTTPSSLAKCGEYGRCKSGYGAYDMLGNVWEWTDAGVLEHAILMGGCWATGSNVASCKSRSQKAFKGYAVRTVGFRCCGGLLPLKQSSEDDKKPSE